MGIIFIQDNDATILDVLTLVAASKTFFLCFSIIETH